MRDPLIDELFGEGDAPLQLYEVETEKTPSYFNGEYNIEHQAQYYRMPCYPSVYAGEHLLYVQLLGSELFSATHYTRRKGLESYLIIQTFAGKGHLVYADRQYELNPGEVFWIDCRQFHAYEAASPEGWGYRMLHFDGSGMSGLYMPVRQSGCVKFKPGSDSVFQNSLRQLLLCAARQDEAFEVAAHRLLTAMICDLLGQLPQYQSQALPETIHAQCRWLQENCAVQLTLENIAEQFHLSKYHMEREFKRYTGYTIFAYVTACRIERAKRMLRTGTLSVAEISVLVGFAEYTSFYRAFCRREKLSPAAYRRRWKDL